MLPDMKQLAETTLVGACKKLIRQQWYNSKHLAINHFNANKGKRTTKADNVGALEEKMTVEDNMTVSKLSMRFYVVAKLQLHYLFLK